MKTNIVFFLFILLIVVFASFSANAEISDSVDISSMVWTRTNLINISGTSNIHGTILGIMYDNDNLYLSYINSSKLYQMSSSDDGLTWSNPITLRMISSTEKFSLITVRNGVSYFLYYQTTTGTYRLAKSSPSIGTFMINLYNNSFINISISEINENHISAIFLDDTGKLYYTASTNNGQNWGPPEILQNSNVSSAYLHYDGDTPIIVWLLSVPPKLCCPNIHCADDCFQDTTQGFTLMKSTKTSSGWVTEQTQYSSSDCFTVGGYTTRVYTSPTITSVQTKDGSTFATVCENRRESDLVLNPVYLQCISLDNEYWKMGFMISPEGGNQNISPEKSVSCPFCEPCGVIPVKNNIDDNFFYLDAWLSPTAYDVFLGYRDTQGTLVSRSPTISKIWYNDEMFATSSEKSFHIIEAYEYGYGEQLYYYKGTPVIISNHNVDLTTTSIYRTDLKKAYVTVYAYDTTAGELYTEAENTYFRILGVSYELSLNLLGNAWTGTAAVNLDPGEYAIDVYIDSYWTKAKLIVPADGQFVLSGNIKNDDSQTIGRILLYDANNFTSGKSELQSQTSSPTYSFIASPGWYIVKVECLSSCAPVVSPAIEVNHDTTYDMSLTSGQRPIKNLRPAIESLYSSTISLMDIESEMLSNLSQKAQTDLKPEPNALEIVGFITSVASGNPDKLIISALSTASMKILEETLSSITNGVINTQISGISTQERKDAVIWLIDDITSHSKSEIKSTPLYQKSATNMLSTKNEFDSRTEQVSSQFSFSRAADIIAAQKQQIELLKSGKMTTVVPADPNTPPTVLGLRKWQSIYLWDSSKLGITRSGKNIITITQISATVAGIITSPTGIGALAMGAVVATASGTKMVLGVIEMGLVESMTLDYLGASFAWVNDISYSQNIFGSTVSFLEQETISPYYTNEQNSFSATVSVNLNPDSIQSGKNILIVPEGQSIVSKMATVTVKNTGLSSKIRGVGEAFWDYDLPNLEPPLSYLMNEWIIGDILGGGVDRIPMTISSDYFSTDVAGGQIITKQLNYSGHNTDPSNILNPHVLTTNIFSGPFMVTSVQEYYYPVTLANAPSVRRFSNLIQRRSLARIGSRTISNLPIRARTSSRQLSLVDFTNYAPTIKLISSGSISSSNPEIIVDYTTPSGVAALEFHLFSPQDQDVNLHLFFADYYHDGYDVTAGTDVVQIQSSTYSGHKTNPEIIHLSSSLPTYQMKIRLESSDSSLPKPYSLYVLEIPQRPAILSVQQDTISTRIIRGEEFDFSIVLAEAGGQQPLNSVVASYNSLLKNLSETKFQVVPAGEARFIQFSIKPTVNYNGQINIATANAGTQPVTVNIQINNPPVLATIQDVVITLGQTATITASVTDTDSDSLTYLINDTRFTQNINKFTWKPSSTGTYYVNVSVSDGLEEDSQKVKITVSPACSNDCSPSGTKQCYGNGYRTCGNYDADSCLEWSSTTTCQSGYTCSSGSCILACSNDCSPSGTKQCVGTTSYKTCGNYDADSCLEWSSTSSCSSGQTCSNGQCITPCSNDCSSSGIRECIGTTTYKACGNYDSDSCLEWSSTKKCSSGYICSGGYCAKKPTTDVQINPRFVRTFTRSPRVNAYFYTSFSVKNAGSISTRPTWSVRLDSSSGTVLASGSLNLRARQETMLYPKIKIPTKGTHTLYIVISDPDDNNTNNNIQTISLSVR
ncbi:MAG: hypothetical protein ABIA21_01775 [Candidatus Aenigmatarchaeota archaeon]